jgi:peptidyl-prolyl cis-trans isomerase SurA
MKIGFLLIALLIVFIQLNAQNLMQIGKENVTVKEFLNNFNKNNTTLTTTKEAALKENLELYIRYKLKLQAAYAAKLDTMPNQIADLAGFKKQIEDKYLTEDKLMNELANEAFARMQKDVRIAHIFVPKGTDTIASFKKINDAYAALKKDIDFATVAKQFSSDPSALANGGDLGFITVFSLPYNLETLAYTTAVGKYSNVFSSKSGYHIFKKTDERQALGKMKGMQILIQVPTNSSAIEKENYKKQIENIYQKLKNGENFESLASSGGILPEFTVGKYDPIFENNFTRLKDNEISNPFLTEFGWHIVKRLEIVAPKKLMDNTTKEELIVKINGDSRKQKAEDAFLVNVLKTINYKPTTIDKNTLANLINTTFQGGTPSYDKINSTTLLHSFAKQKITVGNLVDFVKDAKTSGKYTGNTAQQLQQEYVKATAKEYYKKHLEEYNSDFAAQLKEFKDGNLLFETMEQNVWTKGANNEDALIKFYNANKAKYKWEKSADAIMFNSSNTKVADSVITEIKANPKKWRVIADKYQSAINADSGRFELGNIPVVDRTFFQEKMATTPVSPNNDGNYVFAYIIKLYQGGETRNYEDAKGLAINDYQQKLEEDWIVGLKKKYPVKVNEKTWKELLNKNK